MRETILICALAMVTYVSFAQQTELNKVTIQELAEKSHPIDPSASAAILFRVGTVNFEYNPGKGFEIVTRVKTKIKIYKKEGYEWANAQVDYYADGLSKESVDFSDATTFNLVEGKVVKTRLKSDGEFTEKRNRFWNRKKITMPAVQEGSIIEYEYSVISPNLGHFPDWEFQAEIPVNYCEFKTVIPEYYVYNPNQKGYIFPKTTKNKVQRSVTLHRKERSDSQVTQTTFSSDKIDYEAVQTLFVAEHVPALKDEVFVNNIKNYSSAISHELSIIKMPNSLPKMLSTDWNSVVETIYKDEDFGAELNKSGYYTEDIKAILASANTAPEKALAIFNHVKSTVKWNGYHGYGCIDGVKQAYKNRSGNVAEINLMLVSMMRQAGLNANPVLVSTRDNGISFFPNRTAFNYVIAAIEVNNEVVLYDATEKFSGPDVLPLRDLNWDGRLIRKDGTSVNISMMPKKPSREAVNLIYAINAEGSVQGQYRRQVSDNMALSFRQKNAGGNLDAYLETLENDNNNIEINEYKRENEEDLSKPILETYSFIKHSAAETIGNKIYVSPLLFSKLDENPFKLEKREYPVDFGFSVSSKYNISIEIPEGYMVESLPQGINVGTEGDIGSFKYMIAANGNKIQVLVSTEISKSIVPSTEYGVLKDLFQKMVDKENEKIVLKRI